MKYALGKIRLNGLTFSTFCVFRALYIRVQVVGGKLAISAIHHFQDIKNRFNIVFIY